MNKFTCPVCGYPNPQGRAWEAYDICSCCFIEFEYNNDSDAQSGKSFEEWRKDWISNGMRWGNKSNQRFEQYVRDVVSKRPDDKEVKKDAEEWKRSLIPPKDWDPIKQLKDAGLWKGEA